MKKFVLLMLILGLASVSQAGVIGFYIDGSQEYVGTAGETVNIELIADTACSGIVIDGIVEGDASIATVRIDMGGQVLSATVNGGFSLIDPGYITNYQGALYDTLSGTAVPEIAAGQVLLTLEYQISASWDETGYWVSPLEEGATYTWADGQSYQVAKSYGNLAAVDTLITGVHIIPEPMTMTLLGLGSLIALRRRKK
jgi:hypothetical protein